MRFWPARRRNQLIATLMLAVGGAVAALLIWPPEIFPRVNQDTTHARNFGRTYPPAMLRGDLRHDVRRDVGRVHPNFAAVTRSAELDSALDAVKRSIEQPMTRLGSTAWRRRSMRSSPTATRICSRRQRSGNTTSTTAD